MTNVRVSVFNNATYTNPARQGYARSHGRSTCISVSVCVFVSFMLAQRPSLGVSCHASRPNRPRVGYKSRMCPGTIPEKTFFVIEKITLPPVRALADGSPLSPPSVNSVCESTNTDPDVFAKNYDAIMLQGFHWRSISFQFLERETDWSWHEQVRSKF